MTFNLNLEVQLLLKQGQVTSIVSDLLHLLLFPGAIFFYQSTIVNSGERLRLSKFFRVQIGAQRRGMLLEEGLIKGGLIKSQIIRS